MSPFLRDTNFEKCQLQDFGIYRDLQTVEMGESLKNAEKIRILVLGDSGVGKTSLVLPRMCVRTCASGERGILHKSAVC